LSRRRGLPVVPFLYRTVHSIERIAPPSSQISHFRPLASSLFFCVLPATGDRFALPAFTVFLFSRGGTAPSQPSTSCFTPIIKFHTLISVGSFAESLSTPLYLHKGVLFFSPQALGSARERLPEPDFSFTELASEDTFAVFLRASGSCLGVFCLSFYGVLSVFFSNPPAITARRTYSTSR